MLSVVIPVYRTEATLERCVASIARQQTDMEIILVDDGSPDGSPEICDAWAKKDSRVRVIHQENKGLSGARNAGIDMARGEYLTFVDSDDYLSPGTYPPLMNLLALHPEYDILEFGFVRFENTPQQDDFILSDRVYENKVDYWLKSRAYEHSYACNKIYRRWIFDQVRFPEGQVFEDVQVMPLLLERAQCVATVSIGGYHYMHNEHGITQQAGVKEVGQHLRGCLPFLKELLAGDVLRMDREGDLSRYYLKVLDIQIRYCALSGERAELPYYPFVIPEDLPLYRRLKYRFVRRFGIERYARMLRRFPERI